MPTRGCREQQIKASQLPSAAEKLQLLQLAVETLTSAGYLHVGMDHFALPEDELVKAQANGSLHRNFQGYTTHGHCDLIGLGVSAISSVGDVYCQNAKTLEGYYRAIERGQLPTDKGLELCAEDKMIRELIGSLMCHFQLDVTRFAASYGVDFRQEFAVELGMLDTMIRDGLLEYANDWLRITPRGRYLVRNICMAFDRYLNPAAGSFSKAI